MLMINIIIIYIDFVLKYRHNSIQAVYNNAASQEAVNRKAEYIGRGTGTARYEGVPGTGNDFGYGYGYNNGYNGGYDNGYNNGYGYGRGYGY